MRHAASSDYSPLRPVVKSDHLIHRDMLSGPESRSGVRSGIALHGDPRLEKGPTLVAVALAPAGALCVSSGYVGIRSV